MCAQELKFNMLAVSQGIGTAYRYEDVNYCTSSGDEYGDVSWHSSHTAVELRRYTILKRTPCGMWIADTPHGSCSDKRFVNLKATKKFACLTRTDAIKSFIRRKMRQASIYKARLARAEQALAIARVMDNKGVEEDESKELAKQPYWSVQPEGTQGNGGGKASYLK